MEQLKAKKHAQPPKVRARSKQKGREMLKVRLPSNQKRKNKHNPQACGH